jgi:hypothetical protein
MFSQLGQIVSGIAVANRNGICTKGFMTFGCACPDCIEEMHRCLDRLEAELSDNAQV